MGPVGPGGSGVAVVTGVTGGRLPGSNMAVKEKMSFRKNSKYCNINISQPRIFILCKKIFFY